MKASDRIIEIVKILKAQGMLAAADGNISTKISENEFLITPSGRNKSFIGSEDLVRINAKGDVLGERGVPSSEKWMHLLVYANEPRAKFVIHAHPPHAIAWSIARPELKELPKESMSELILAVGSIPFVPYARPGTPAMGEVLKPFINTNRAFILSRHGALSWGETWEEALNGMERLEHSAKILQIASTIGKITSLPQEELNELYRMRKDLGDRSL